MKKKLFIDQLLRDTWLMVVTLRNGAVADDGQGLYQKGLQLVETARQQMSEAGYSDESVDHISYAQCALLDETVLNRSRENRDNGYDIWQKTPLQARIFNTLQAGELLYQRMYQVLNQPAPNPAVLTCFHRVLMMGFEGIYRNNPPERQALLNALTLQVPAFEVAPVTPLLSTARGGRRGLWRSRSLWFWGLTSVVVVALLWFGLHWQLQRMLQLWLPEISDY